MVSGGVVRGIMKSRLARRGLLALGVVVIVGVALVAALPLIASTQIVRDRIAYELSVWSGYRVTLGQAPALSVWPSFRAHLTDVRLTEWSAAEAPPVLEAERVEMDLSALAALRGEVSFSRIALVRPLLRVAENGALLQPELGRSGGRLLRAIEMSRSMVDAEQPASPAASMPDIPFGTIEFTDGRIAVSRAGTDEPVVTGLAGRIYWPTLRRGADLKASGIWRGENFVVEMSSGQPLSLFSGAEAPLKFTFEAPPAGLSFDGSAILSSQPYFTGTGRFSSPSLRRFLEWSQTEISAGAAIGSLTVSGAVTGEVDRLKVENVELDLNGNMGAGVLDLSLGDDVPAIAGTLAFRTLDLRSFMSAFMPLAASRGQMDDPVDSELANQISLDLRLSAANARGGNVALTDLAATIQVKRGLAAFDLSDATVFGGTVQAGLKIDRAGPNSAAELRLNAEGVDAAALMLSAGMKGIVPQSRANLALAAKGVGADWNAVLANADGTVTATLGEGTLAGFDLTDFLSRAALGEFFALADVTSGSLAISGAELKARLHNGVLRIDKSETWLSDRTISIEGIVPYMGRALALSGEIARKVAPEEERAAPDAVFFIGGGWDAPFVSPVLYFGDVN